MIEGERKGGRNEATVSLVAVHNERFSRLGELVPGISNAVTLKEICTKMSSCTLHALSSLNRAWRHAIQSRVIYDTRVQSHATETLVVLSHSHSSKTEGIALYSLRDKAFYHLPPIPGVNSGIPRLCQCVGFDGKLYILGGRANTPSSPFGQQMTEKVYVMDVGGQRKWKECANMHKPGAGGGCGVMDGKIYFFNSYFYPGTSEVYDPNTDAWSGIETLGSGIPEHYVQVATMEEELFLLGNHHTWAYDPVKLESRELPLPRKNSFTRASFNELPLPRKMLKRTSSRELRQRFPDFRNGARVRVFTTHGKFHSMSASGIDVFDFDTNSWTLLHSYSLDEIAPGLLWIDAALAVEGELLALVTHQECFGILAKTFLMQSQGFNREDEEIEWRKVECPLGDTECTSGDFGRFRVMCPIQL